MKMLLSFVFLILPIVLKTKKQTHRTVARIKELKLLIKEKQVLIDRTQVLINKKLKLKKGLKTEKNDSDSG